MARTRGSSALRRAGPAAERRGGRLLRGRLSDAAGDADGGNGMTIPERGGEVAQRGERIGHEDEERVTRDPFGDARDDGPARAPRERVGDEFVAVARAGEGEEEAIHGREPGVEAARAEHDLARRWPWEGDPAARRLEKSGEAEHG